MRGHRETVRVNTTDDGLVLDPKALECHGGRAAIVWTVGNLEPILPDTGIHLSAVMDGNTVGSILRGAARGPFNDTPAELLAVVDCPQGPHTLGLRIDAASGAWGIPYVVNVGDPPSQSLLVNRGFVVREVWD